MSSDSYRACCLMQIALGNILKFRKKNWQFDFIGGIIYFILVFSMFPQVKFLLNSLKLVTIDFGYSNFSCHGPKMTRLLGSDLSLSLSL